mgnify:CR=1 FL=1
MTPPPPPPPPARPNTPDPRTGHGPGSPSTRPPTLPAPDRDLERLASIPKLLVLLDYDGTLAPIVPNPPDAAPHPRAVPALQLLAELPNTPVAVVSGRALEHLTELADFPADVELIGSHGAESRLGLTDALTPEQTDLLAAITGEVERIAAEHAGCTAETKPAAVALHHRNASDDVAERAERAVRDGPADRPGVKLKPGKRVLELAVTDAHKGKSFEQLLETLEPDAALFIGDDVTDEDVFERLRPFDLGVKVGPGDTSATTRLPDPAAVAEFLHRLAAARLRGGA